MNAENPTTYFMRYRNANAGHNILVMPLYQVIARLWMCEVLEENTRFPVGSRIRVSLDDLTPEVVA